MATITAVHTFAYSSAVFTHGVNYDTSVAVVSAANAALPHMFSSAGTKTAKDTFAFRDSRGGGLDRIVWKGDLLASNDPAVTQAPGLFS